MIIPITLFVCDVLYRGRFLVAMKSLLGLIPRCFHSKELLALVLIFREVNLNRY